MKVVFAGPSLYGTAADLSGIDLRPPAEHGHVLRAVGDGAVAIGLIDGAFEAVAAVWHKEILYALDVGVAVVGGASMGALRAAECAAYGMEPVGQVARAYLSGSLDDDAAVALTHGPAELGCPPLTEALVDCEATLSAMERAGAIDPGSAWHAANVARSLHYKDRTIERLASAAFRAGATDFAARYRRFRVGVKTADALAVVDRVRQLPDHRAEQKRTWTLNCPPSFGAALRAASFSTRCD